MTVVVRLHWVLSLFGFSAFTQQNSRPHGIIIVGIYMSSNIYYLFIFAKLLQAYSSASLLSPLV